MKTSMLLAIFAIGGVVAFAGLAAAAGADMGVLNGRDGAGDRMMSHGGGCHGSGGQFAQCQYGHDGDCPSDCQAELMNQYSWSCGEGNMTCGGAEYRYQGECPATCDNSNSWNYSWDRGYNYCGH